jgi:hypothetical protein
LQHDVGVDPADVGLAEALVAARLLDHREILEAILDRPDVSEAVRGLDRVVDRAEQQVPGLRVAVERQVPEVEHRVVEVPGIDRVGVLVLRFADVGKIAPQGFEFGVVEPVEAAFQLGFERILAAVPLAPFVQRLDHRQLDHRIRIFAVRVGHDVEIALVARARLARRAQVPQSALAAADPVAVFDLRQVERGVGGAEHLHELARHFLLVVARPVAQHHDRVGQHDLLAGARLPGCSTSWLSGVGGR